MHKNLVSSSKALDNHAKWSLNLQFFVFVPDISPRKSPQEKGVRGFARKTHGDLHKREQRAKKTPRRARTPQ